MLGTSKADSDGALTSIAEPGGNCAGFNPTTNPPTTASLCTVMLVDRNGDRLITVYPGNLARQTNTYDTSGRISEIKATGQAGGAAATLYDYVYGYTGTTDSSHITKRTDGVSGAYLTYTYTTEGRLHSSVSRNSGGTVSSSRTWCYDANGNRTSFSATYGATCPGTATSSWDGANQQLTGPDGAASLFTFDLDGQETSTATADPTASTHRTSTYSVSDQTATTNVAGTNLISTYLGGGNNNIITSDVNTTDQDELRNSPLGISRVARTSSGTETGRIYAERDPSGAIFGYRNSANAHYYPMTDIQGNVMRVVDSTGNVADSYNYSEWGVQTVATNTFPQPFGYLGAYTNSTTGLIHLGARYYDPSLGRFTQPDPSTHPGDVNQSSPYTYAGDDPINHTDRSGLASNTQEIGGCLFGICAHIGETTDSNGNSHLDLGGGLSSDLGPSVDYTDTTSTADGTDSGGSIGASYSVGGATGGVEEDADGDSYNAGVDYGSGDAEPEVAVDANYEF